MRGSSDTSGQRWAHSRGQVTGPAMGPRQGTNLDPKAWAQSVVHAGKPADEQARLSKARPCSLAFGMQCVCAARHGALPQRDRLVAQVLEKTPMSASYSTPSLPPRDCIHGREKRASWFSQRCMARPPLGFGAPLQGRKAGSCILVHNRTASFEVLG